MFDQQCGRRPQGSVEAGARANAQAGIFIGWQDEVTTFDKRSVLSIKIAREAFDLFNQTNDPANFMERILDERVS